MELPEKSRNSDFLKSLGVEPGYMLAVSRIEPEKGLDVLVDAFNMKVFPLPWWKQ